jgi:lysophospholipase L1-like esterase
VKRKGLSAAIVLVAAFLFGWGYLAGTDGVFPHDQIESLRSRFAPGEEEAPQLSAYWQEKSSFFDTLGARASVVMIGDSLTDGAEWSEMFPGVAIANRGIDGDTTAGVLRRMQGILSVHAEKAFVMLGINDFGKDGRTVDAVFADYSDIVSRLEKAGTKVYLQSTLSCNEARAGWISCSAIQGKIRELNARLASLASPSVVYIDLNAWLAGEGGLKPDFTYDGVHLNGDGYKIWKREISKFVRAG